MTSAYIADVVRTVLAEYGLPDTLVRVAILPFSWEVILRSPTGVEQHLIVPNGSSEVLADTVRWAITSR